MCGIPSFPSGRCLGADHRRGAFIQLLRRVLGDWTSHSHPDFVWNPVVGKTLYPNLLKNICGQLFIGQKSADTDKVQSDTSLFNGVKIKPWLRCSPAPFSGSR